MPRRVETICVQDDLVPSKRVIIVRLWCEDAGAGAFAFRAWVVPTLNMASKRSTMACASTIGAPSMRCAPASRVCGRRA